MKKWLLLVCALVMIPTAAFAATQGSGTEAERINERNAAMTEYLQTHLTMAAVYDDQLRQDVISDFYDAHPEYLDIGVRDDRLVDKKIGDAELLKNDHAAINITYYADGSMMLGVATCSGGTLM